MKTYPNKGEESRRIRVFAAPPGNVISSIVVFENES